MGLRRAVGIGALVAMIAVLVAAYGGLVPWDEDARKPVVDVANIGSPLLAALAILTALPVRRPRRALDSTPDQVRSAREVVARDVRRWVEREVRHQELDASALVNLRVPGRHDEAPTVDDLVGLVTGGRLLITGAPGTGKSSAALLVVDRLLRDADHAGPVPVVFDIPVWDPELHALEDWLVGRLAFDHRLADDTHYGSRAARYLVVDGHVLPVLDGIDELAPAAEKAVHAFLEHWPHPVLVTRRWAAGVNQLARDLDLRLVKVVEIAPETALAHLAAKDRRWQAVLDLPVKARSRSGLVNALRTPLMVFLAREVTRVGAEPVGLVDRFRTRVEAEDYLLAHFVPAVFEACHRRRGRLSKAEAALVPRRTRSWSPRRAERWLRFLASRATHDEGRSVRWWRLWETTSSLRFAFFLVGFVAPLATGSLINLVRSGSPLPGTTALLIAYTLSATLAFMPVRRLRSELRKEPALDLGTSIGSLVAVLVGLGLTRALGPVVGVVGALVAFGLVFKVSHVADLRTRDGEVVMDPSALMRRLRTTALTGACCYAVAMVVVVSWWYRFVPELLLVGLAIALAALRMSLWGVFVAVRVRSAVAGRLPWRLMRFLRDADALGVLRRTGPTFLFRHERLRVALADKDDADKDDADKDD
ncbi:hypothetical protein GCM10022243_57710 [Saccharothrix violaceirubra]|uniref:NACHT domain-containing protein n=1 Tax=Saccharothrix violaceirubra TaxID=413306 RepID=A0A7W7T393_9PSEU|nr:hypothetical protein [Saccharothrix violaceirubra]MBB4965797.1 hypothetical protein [Saccharothrix violaceirubra]